jgi:hypothetical protein
MWRAGRALILVQAIAAAATASIGIRAAHACGGFFCNRPPPDGSLPIAQAAENVLFVMDTDPATGAKRVEAHIQILYTGPASSFSWIVPVTAVPTVDVGWDILFARRFSSRTSSTAPVRVWAAEEWGAARRPAPPGA